MKKLRPLHDKIDYANALEILDALAGHELSPDQDDYFAALALLVEAYEAAHGPKFPVKKGVPLLKHLLAEHNFSAAGLSRLLGTDRSLGVRILHKERRLTVPHLKKLAKHFQVPADLFID